MQKDLVCTLAAAACCVVPLIALPANAAEKVIHAFEGHRDGSTPYTGLISDGAGNAYGTTWGGGEGCPDGGCGTIYKLTKDGKVIVLYAFKGGSDGEGPIGPLMMDASGNLYGTTAYGGQCTTYQYGCGTVFKLAPDGKEQVLYTFQGGSDGYYPTSNVVMDQSGNLYGTTEEGGTYNSICGEGCGTVFEIQPNGSKLTLYQFQSGTDAENPIGPLVTDSAGNIYGTTISGGGTCGALLSGCGTVFEVTPSGQEQVLYAFQGHDDGSAPIAGVIMDDTGNLYGTTFGGGSTGMGVVFEIPAGGGSETTLHSFLGGSDGANPVAGVIMDGSGNLYGTTELGGKENKCKKVGGGCGTVFEVTPAGKETVLFAFSGKNGAIPEAPLLLGQNGALYGTTTQGGDRKGVIFEVTP